MSPVLATMKLRNEFFMFKQNYLTQMICIFDSFAILIRLFLIILHMCRDTHINIYIHTYSLLEVASTWFWIEIGHKEILRIRSYYYYERNNRSRLNHEAMNSNVTSYVFLSIYVFAQEK